MSVHAIALVVIPHSRRSICKFLKSVSAPGRFRETYRFRVGVKVFNLTNHFNPRDFQGNLASDEFGGFYNGVGRKLGMSWSERLEA